MTSSTLFGVVAAWAGPLGWCVALGALIGGDPLFALEVAGAATAAVWGLLVARELIRSRRLAAALTSSARETVLFGVPCRITPALGLDAVVLGSMRPTIFVGRALVETLADDELRAVVYHEDHHRRTRAPVRAAALDTWLRLLGRSDGIRDVILERLADLETLADAHAIQRGSSARSLARALLKGDESLQPVSFAYAAERRVDELVGRAAGISIAPRSRLPYEWVPVTLLTVAIVGCHAGL